ncbi:sugar phosphate isomerase/epimerase [Mycolicibacterium farcinogenes]|nr:sugar phosphate isomerase/epimerase [Mycolicibacterium farcinogenes]
MRQWHAAVQAHPADRRVRPPAHLPRPEPGRRGVALWTESPHFFRLCFDIDRAQQLMDRLDENVGIVMDFSHIVASGGDPVDFVDRFGPRIRHVHIRDAVPGNINLSVGNGQVDFATGLKSLADAGYPGHFALELETRDVTHVERPAAAAAAGTLISSLI